MRDFRAPMFAIAGALLGLILLLATLQYRWQGQISGAERDRMTATLHTRAKAFGEDFDRELTRAYLMFQLDQMWQDAQGAPPAARPSAAAGVATRYDRWQATARFPKMIRDVYLVPSQTAANEAALLQRFNPSNRFLEPVDWPDSLAGIRKQIAKPAPSWTGGTAPVVMRSMIPAVWADVPALVIPTPFVMLSHLSGNPAAPMPSMSMESETRYAVLVLDADYIRRDMLPALARQHFQGTGDGFDYQLAVVPTAAESKDLVYHSVPEFVPGAESAADAKVELFQVRPKDFDTLVSEVSRFAMFTATAPQHVTGNRTFIREGIAPPGGRVSIRSTPMSIVVQSGSPSAVQERVDRLITGAATYSSTTRVNLPPPPHWRLLVKHPSGSLEQAVNAVRRRNLLVSTSILGILGVSVGFLVLSTRRAQDLARQQLEFVATVSHELRTPLAVIRSAADNLADGVVNDEARVRQYGQLVRREGVRLTDLVEQILEFAGLQSGQRTMTARPVAVGGMLRDVVAAAEPVAQPAGIAIELDIADNLPQVAGDEAALRRAFQNLIGNALKYGAGARWVGVRAAFTGGHVEVSVTDRGIGIAAADQTKIFDPFYRAPDVVAAQIQGAGLGLSLVKRIVEAHAGQIALQSTPGQGSTFTVSLPILKGDVAEGHDGVSQAAPQPL